MSEWIHSQTICTTSLLACSLACYWYQSSPMLHPMSDYFQIQKNAVAWWFFCSTPYCSIGGLTTQVTLPQRRVFHQSITSSSSYCATERVPACRCHARYSSLILELGVSQNRRSQSLGNPSRCVDDPMNYISDHIRPPRCLNLSPVVGVGFSNLKTQSSRSSIGNSIRKIPLQKYAAQATNVAISASIQ